MHIGRQCIDPLVERSLVLAVGCSPFTFLLGLLVTGTLSPGQVKVYLTVNGAEKRSTVPRADSSFTFVDVPPGVHLLEVCLLPFLGLHTRRPDNPSFTVHTCHVLRLLQVSAMGLLFPVVRIELSAQHNGRIRASFVEDERRPLKLPLVLRPTGQVTYFQQREDISLCVPRPRSL